MCKIFFSNRKAHYFPHHAPCTLFSPGGAALLFSFLLKLKRFEKEKKTGVSHKLKIHVYDNILCLCSSVNCTDLNQHVKHVCVCIPVFPQHFGNLAALHALFLRTREMVGDSGGGPFRFSVHTGTSATAAWSQAGAPALGTLPDPSSREEEDRQKGWATGPRPEGVVETLAAPQGMGAPSLPWVKCTFT